MAASAIPPARRTAAARRGALAVFALVAVSLIGAVLLIFQTIETERGAREQARRTSAVLAELGQIRSAVLNAETGQRGYLITLDQRYLAPYRAARDQYAPALARLRGLVAGDGTPRQRELVDRVDALTSSKFGEMADSVELIGQGRLLEARGRVLTDEGLEVMARLRGALRELEAIERDQLDAATRKVSDAESRVLPLLAALLALLLVTLVLGYRLVGRAARAEAIASQAALVAEARDRADLLARELNHRVKNLFAVVLAIVRMSGKDAPQAKPVVDSIAERIHALLTAHQATQGTLDNPVAALKALIETTVRPYLTAERRIVLDGPEVDLPEKQVTPLGLVLHELTTNAVKYGCWANGGELRVVWRLDAGDLALEWIEDCPGEGGEPSAKGFGSLLMTSAARQLRGSIERRFTPEGVRVAIRLPLAGERG